MSETKVMPQMEAESVSKGAQRARYTAYMQCVRKLEMKAKEKEEKKRGISCGSGYDPADVQRAV